MTDLSMRLPLMLLGLAASAPAAAQDYTAREVGDWTVAASRDGDGCFTTRSYPREGATTLLLGLSVDGSNRLTVLNANWSIKPRDRLTLDIRLSNARFPKQFAVGLRADAKQGFVTSFDARFPAQFAAATTLAIFRGKVPVERLTLVGSGAAVAELRRCVAASGQTPGQRAKPRADAIPKDPFAESAPRRPKR